MTSTKKSPLINCPTCNKQIAWTPENTFRPFCSERCKMIDLGVWAKEGYSIACEETDPFAEYGSVDDPSHLQ